MLTLFGRRWTSLWIAIEGSVVWTRTSTATNASSTYTRAGRSGVRCLFLVIWDLHASSSIRGCDTQRVAKHVSIWCYGLCRRCRLRLRRRLRLLRRRDHAGDLDSLRQLLYRLGLGMQNPLEVI